MARIPREIIPYSTNEYHLRIAPGEGLTINADLFHGAQKYITVDYQNGQYMTTVRSRLMIDTGQLFDGKRLNKKALQHILDEWFVSRTPQAPDFTFQPWVMTCIRLAVTLFVSLDISARIRVESFQLLNAWVRKKYASDIEKLGNSEVAQIQFVHDHVQAIRRWQKLKYSLQLRKFDKIQMPLDLYDPRLHGVFPQLKSLHSMQYELYLLARTQEMTNTDADQAKVARGAKQRRFRRRGSQS